MKQLIFTVHSKYDAKFLTFARNVRLCGLCRLGFPWSCIRYISVSTVQQ